MAEASPGKDSVTGHWELMGLVLERPFPTFPDGFPAGGDRRVRAAHRPDHRSATRSRPARRSSTSSGPSTCGPAARSSTRRPTASFRSPRTKRSIPIPELYRICEIAYELVGLGQGVGRVIARPFVGAPGRLPAHAEPPRLRADAVRADAARPAEGRGHAVVAIGKIEDLFAGRGMTHGRPHDERRSRDGRDRGGDGVDRPRADLRESRRLRHPVRPSQRIAGYAANLERFDARLAALLPRLRADDLLIVTADHGNDPTTPSTDHSREYVPVLLYGAGGAAGHRSRRPPHVRGSRADPRGAFGVGPLQHGTSFLGEIWS